MVPLSVEAVNYSTLFTGITDEALKGITTVAPLGLKIGGVILAISIAWKVIRKFAK